MGQSRTENILENMLGASNPITEPQSREEALLKQILESGGGGGSHTYSDEEQEVGKWIDGRTVYEKTVYNAGGLSGDFLIPHGITDLDRVISCQGSYYDTNAGTSGAIGVVPRIENNLIGVTTFTSTNIQIRVPTIFGTRIVDWYFDVRYIKTES